MYGDTFTGTGGDLKAFKATIGDVSAQEKIKEADMNKTKIDIKNGYVTSLGRAVDRKIDNVILGAVTESSINAKLNKIGNATAELSALVKDIIAAVIGATVAAEYTPDGHKGTALVIDKKAWTKIATSDYVLNSDYGKAFGGDATKGMTTFFGAEVICLPGLTAGKAYVIPSNTVCFAEWESSNKADAVFVPTDGRTYHCQAVKSGGAVCAEPEAITEITYKVA